MVCMASQHPKKKMSANSCSHTFRFTFCRLRQNRTLAQQRKWRAKVSSLVTSYLEACEHSVKYENYFRPPLAPKSMLQGSSVC